MELINFIKKKATKACHTRHFENNTTGEHGSPSNLKSEYISHEAFIRSSNHCKPHASADPERQTGENASVINRGALRVGLDPEFELCAGDVEKSAYE